MEVRLQISNPHLEYILSLEGSRTAIVEWGCSAVIDVVSKYLVQGVAGNPSSARNLTLAQIVITNWSGCNLTGRQILMVFVKHLSLEHFVSRQCWWCKFLQRETTGFCQPKQCDTSQLSWQHYSNYLSRCQHEPYLLSISTPPN